MIRIRKRTREEFDRICGLFRAKYIEDLANPIKINGPITTMYFLMKGIMYECLIDTNDLPKICIGKVWVGNNSPTSKRVRVRAAEKGKAIFLHHCIAPREEGKVTDHINRDTLDNRSCNLRTVTHGQNMLNKKDYTNSKAIKRSIAKHGDGYKVCVQRYYVNLKIAQKARDEMNEILDKHSAIDALLR